MRRRVIYFRRMLGRRASRTQPLGLAWDVAITLLQVCLKHTRAHDLACSSLVSDLDTNQAVHGGNQEY